jgi:PAS domain S-box-containing protein
MSSLAVYVWTRRSVTGARVLFATLVSIAELCLAGALEDHATTLAGHVFWQHVQIAGYAAMPVCAVLLCLGYVGHPWRGWRVAALFVIPVGGVLVHWTNQWHHLYWTRVWVDRSAATPIMGRSYGVGFWICVIYSYILVVAAGAILVPFLVRVRAQRMRTAVFLIGILLPSAASLFYVFEWFPIRYLDITPYALSVTGVCIAWGVLWNRFQGIVPVAARSVVASMADGVIVLDLDGRLADLNPAAEALLACSKENLVGNAVEQSLGAYEGLFPYFRGDRQMSGDVVLPSAGERRLCAVNASAVRQGRHAIGRVITLRDVTAERAASDQLRQAREAAEAAAIAKSRFLANMSHEIRTPMNGVVGATELLLDSGLNDEQAELVHTAQDSAHALLSILNDILDFSKIDAGKLSLEEIPFDLHRLLTQIVRLMEPVAEKKVLALHLRIAPGVPRVIVGDPTRLRQVVLNLIGNAIKFTSAGWVALSVERLASPHNETRLALAVEDTGIGIAPDRINRLFQEFSQADSSVTRHFGGTGLGLAISQRLVEKMGGRIRVESTLGKGSSFVVETPVRLGDEYQVLDAQHLTLSESETFPGCRILLAEDNAVNQRIGQRILEKLGCLVDVANNGSQAVAAAEAADYEVILMDLHMPEMDGLQATREIRRRGNRTPIVALTASVLDETRNSCQEAGMDAFITKPIRLDEIAAILKRYGGAVTPSPSPGTVASSGTAARL